MFFEELLFLAFPCSTDWLAWPYSKKMDTVYILKVDTRNELSMNLYDCAAYEKPPKNRSLDVGKKYI